MVLPGDDVLSCVLVCPILVPSRRDVNDEADKESEDQVEEANDNPLADVEMVGHFKVVYFIFAEAFDIVRVSGLFRLGEVALVMLIGKLGLEKAIVVLFRPFRHNINLYNY